MSVLISKSNAVHAFCSAQTSQAMLVEIQSVHHLSTQSQVESAPMPQSTAYRHSNNDAAAGYNRSTPFLGLSVQSWLDKA